MGQVNYIDKLYYGEPILPVGENAAGQPSALPDPVFYRFGNYWIENVRFPPLPAFQAPLHVQKRAPPRPVNGLSGIYSIKPLPEVI